MKTPVIKVHVTSNLVHVGKSSLSLIIQKALAEAGYTNVKLTGTHPENYDYISKEIKNTEKALNTEIVINDVGYTISTDYDPFTKAIPAKEKGSVMFEQDEKDFYYSNKEVPWPVAI